MHKMFAGTIACKEEGGKEFLIVNGKDIAVFHEKDAARFGRWPVDRSNGGINTCFLSCSFFPKLGIRSPFGWYLKGTPKGCQAFSRYPLCLETPTAPTQHVAFLFPRRELADAFVGCFMDILGASRGSGFAKPRWPPGVSLFEGSL